jgi:fermentation-respiration switch protein FrsA (DUF1100 family)
MNKQITKIIRWAAIIVGLSFVGTVLISYRTIKKSLGRVTNVPSIQKIILKNRERLEQQLHAQKVSFLTSDGIRLQGYLVLRKGAKRNLLICHGYRSAKEMLIDFADMFQRSNLLFFDFRAHGQSEGDLVTLGYNEKKDVLSALNFLQTDERTKKLPIFGIGVSMGGVALLAAAAEKPVFKGLVIDSAFARLEDQIAYAFYQRTGLPKYPFLIVTRFLFELLTHIRVREVSVLDYVRNISIPILFIHAENDTEVPLEGSKELYEAATEKKDLWIEGPCKHATICLEYRDEYEKRVNTFFGYRF